MYLRSFFSAALLLSSSISLKGYLIGYDRLYCRKNNVTIDILHDDHQSQRRLSRKQMERKPFSYVKSRLYKTEMRILDALANIQSVRPEAVELVWELGKFHVAGDSAFLAHGHNLVRKKFTKLRFVAGDLARDAFEGILLERPSRRSKNLNYRIDGTSIGKPVPLPDNRIKAIERNYGQDKCQLFKGYFDTTAQRATKHYKKGFLRGKRFKKADFKRQSRFHTLGDIEMLSYVLASKKKHIILYCGGWHADNITEFLVKKMGFRLTHEVYNDGYEIRVKDMAPLDRDYQAGAPS